MTVHHHSGPNGLVIEHNHNHGYVEHDHGSQKGFRADLWTFHEGPQPKIDWSDDDE